MPSSRTSVVVVMVRVVGVVLVLVRGVDGGFVERTGQQIRGVAGAIASAGSCSGGSSGSRRILHASTVSKARTATVTSRKVGIAFSGPLTEPAVGHYGDSC
jgi:drug/metabolite transporter (DMT)-like permease